MRKNLFRAAGILLITFLISAASLPHSLYGNTDIAVIKGMYDDVGLVLGTYKIPYKILTLKDLENYSLLSRFDSIFLPSGIDKPVYENIDLLAMGTKIMSVNLKKDYYELNDRLIIENLKNFIEKGGSAYFSGYSYKYIQDSYEPFEFFEKFPYIGLPGKITATLKNDLKRYINSDTAPLNIQFPGWVAIKSAKDSEIIAEAEFETPRGTRRGPLSLLLHKGKGEILYTSYYSNALSEFRRFHIYRIAGIRLLRDLMKIGDSYEQTMTGKLADSVLPGEHSKLYNLSLQKGNNTIYFLTGGGYFQIDIYDSKMGLITSVDKFENYQAFDIKSDKDDLCYVKLYPSGEKRFEMYALESAAGPRYFPYYKKIITGIIALALISFIIYIIIFIKSKKYTRMSLKTFLD